MKTLKNSAIVLLLCVMTSCAYNEGIELKESKASKNTTEEAFSEELRAAWGKGFEMPSVPIPADIHDEYCKTVKEHEVAAKPLIDIIKKNDIEGAKQYMRKSFPLLDSVVVKRSSSIDSYVYNFYGHTEKNNIPFVTERMTMPMPTPQQLEEMKNRKKLTIPYTFNRPDDYVRLFCVSVR